MCLSRFIYKYALLKYSFRCGNVCNYTTIDFNIYIYTYSLPREKKYIKI